MPELYEQIWACLETDRKSSLISGPLADVSVKQSKLLLTLPKTSKVEY